MPRHITAHRFRYANMSGRLIPTRSRISTMIQKASKTDKETGEPLPVLSLVLVGAQAQACAAGRFSQGVSFVKAH